MSVVRIQTWEVNVPDGWMLKPGGETALHFESPDQKLGCVVRALRLPAPRETSRDAARFVQEARQRSLQKSTERNWKTVEASESMDGDLSRSLLVVIDDARLHLLASAILSSNFEAIHLSLQDYYCVGYEETRRTIEDIAMSMRRARGTASN